MIAGMIMFQIHREGMHWSLQTQILAYIGITVVAIILGRQSLALHQNRQLSDSLSTLSEDLAARLEELAALSQRLQALNVQANHLNTLHSVPEIASKGVDLACLAANARSGWVVLTDSSGAEQIAAVYPADSRDIVPLEPDEDEEVQVLPLETRSGVIGRACVIRRTGADPGPSMAEAITAHIATAIENTRRYEEALRQAQNDALTGLLNHRSIHARLAEECKRADRTGAPVSLIMMDADDFKVLNDTCGHPAGDQVLLQIGRTIRGLLRQSDAAGRVGGDEFMLILPDTDGEGAAEVSDRLRHMLAGAPFQSPTGQLIPLRLSLGVATYPTDAELPARLVEVADANLYISKQRGGNAVTGCESSRETPDDGGGMLGMAGRLLDVVGARDHYTRRHSERVVTYSLALGDAIGMSDDSKHTLRLAAMLHDVGKIGVPARILRKPGALDPREAELVRRHVDIGESMIRDMPRLEAVLRAVRSHHEWYDGKGYPDGIRGDDIPLLAKILAIADAYAAMTVDKPYRRGMPGPEAEKELLRVAGTQLDPGLVREFIRTCAQGNTETELAPTSNGTSAYSSPAARSSAEMR
jgi:diguanylate cyclase (GGDEF)-like protein